MIPKRAISKAIEGGWQNGPQRRAELDIGWSVYEKIALDPSFWQALGKALGRGSEGIIPYYDWEKHAASFHRFIMKGGDIQKFWDELIK